MTGGLGLEHQAVLGLPPVEFVHLAADLGCPSIGEGFVVQPDADVRRYEADLDVMAELEASKVNVVSFDPDLGRTFDAFGQLAEMAAARGMRSTVEFARPCR